MSRPSLMARLETALRGWVHTDDPTLGSGRFDLGSLNGMLATRRTSDVLYSDGATSARGAWWPLGAPGALGGMPLELVAEIDVPTSAFTVGAALAAFADATGLSDVANCLALKLGPPDALFLRQYGATTGDYRLFYYGGFRTAYAGQRVRIRASFPAPNTATSPTVYLNEVDCSASFSLSTSVTPPNWVPPTFQTSRFVSGYFAPAGRFVPHGPILGSLTVAEGLAWLQTGRMPTWCEAGTGSAVAQTSGALTVGRKYRIAAFVAGDSFTNVGAASNATGVEFVATGTTPTTWTNASQLLTLGPVIKPVVQPCLVLDDAGANGISGVLAAGITPITADKWWRIRAPVDMSTTGAKQLLGAAVFAEPHKQAIDSIDVECAGAPTFSLGDGSGGSAQYSASAAHTAGRARRTIASPFPADSAKTGVYANVTVSHASATAEKITLCGHRTD